MTYRKTCSAISRIQIMKRSSLTQKFSAKTLLVWLIRTSYRKKLLLLWNLMPSSVNMIICSERSKNKVRSLMWKASKISQHWAMMEPKWGTRNHKRKASRAKSSITILNGIRIHSNKRRKNRYSKWKTNNHKLRSRKRNWKEKVSLFFPWKNSRKTMLSKRPRNKLLRKKLKRRRSLMFKKMLITISRILQLWKREGIKRKGRLEDKQWNCWVDSFDDHCQDGELITHFLTFCNRLYISIY